MEYWKIIRFSLIFNFYAAVNGESDSRRKSTSTGDLNSINQCNNNNNNNNAMPFIPSKRIIQHHEYQNLVDDVTPTIVNGFRKRETQKTKYSEHGTYDSIIPMPDNRYVDNNINNRKNRKERETNCNGSSAGPVYRHFGDTNLLRSNGKSPLNYNNRLNKSSSTTSLATTATTAIVDTSPIYGNRYRTRSFGQDIDCSHSDQKLSSIDKHRVRSTDSFNPMASNPYITSNLTNDTGFSSMDADNSSTITPTNKITNKTTSKIQQNYYAAFNQVRCMNYDVKNRIKMFDVVDRSAAYRPVVCHKNYKLVGKSRSDKRSVCEYS